VSLIDILARLWFALGLFIVIVGFFFIAGGFVLYGYWRFFPARDTNAPIAAPDTDEMYYRQRPRRAIRLLLARIEQLGNELEAARQENRRLRGYPDKKT
jgi:hypothetical protein